MLILNHSKIWDELFLTMGLRFEKWIKSWKVPPGGGGEILNVTWHILDIFNFCRCQFSNVSALFTSMDPLSKKFTSDFL